MSDERPPDFTMQRAVEILADIYERARSNERVPPPPADRPIVMFSETIALDVTSTTRADVERALGVAFAYPQRGWHTYCVRGDDGRRLFLSCFYAKDRLASAELYLPRVERAPNLAPRDLRFRLVPGEIAIGRSITTLPEHFAPAGGLPTNLGPYAQMFEARFPGGAAYAMGNEGALERLAIYVLV
ncbi:MAG: hypothetical protein KGN02_05325 [bacterium]|nr:hypothetical protein [bacterium]